MLPNRVSNPGPLTYESGALPIALRGPAGITKVRGLHVKRDTGLMSKTKYMYHFFCESKPP